jgi:SAM-dependent methyltransferase
MHAAQYDRLWRTTYGDMQRIGPVHRHMRERLVRLVARLDVESVLDVGCGSGQDLSALAAAGNWRLAGADISKEGLALARRMLPGVEFHDLDLERAALPMKFDLVLNTQVIEHILDDVKALRNLARMTGKYLFVSTTAGRMRPSEIPVGHVRNYSPVELRRKLELVGLDIVEMDRWGFPFYSPLFRTAAEWLPAGPPSGEQGRVGLVAAAVLYQLYRLNLPGRGDVITALARPKRAAPRSRSEPT